jgi:hypothetical protein
VGGRPPLHVEQVTTRTGTNTPSAPNTELTLIRGHVFRIDTLLMLFGIQGCGGGGSVRRRNALHEVGGRVPEVPRARMREQVVKHTPTLTFHIFSFLINHNFTHSTYAQIFSPKNIIKNHQKKSQNTLNSRVKSSIFKGKMPFFHVLSFYDFSHFLFSISILFL